MNGTEAAQKMEGKETKIERGTEFERRRRKICVPKKNTNERKVIRIINDMNIMQMRMERRSQQCE